jgi:hypothetical protein
MQKAIEIGYQTLFRTVVRSSAQFGKSLPNGRPELVI